MKHRNPGITLKIFLYLLAFVLVMVLAISVFQTYALERSYEENRIAGVSRLAQQILERPRTAQTERLLNSMAVHEDICIHVLDQNGVPITSSQQFRNCMVHRMSSSELASFLEEVRASEDGTAARIEDSSMEIFGLPEGKGRNRAEGQRGQGLALGAERPAEPNVERVRMKSLAYAAMGQDGRGEPCYVLIGTTITPLDSTVLVLRQQMGFVVVFLVAAAALLAWLMARGIARPIIAINQSAKEFTKHNYDVVFDTEGYREITELKDTLNEAAVELSRTEELRRDLMANISHDLRTPLTMIMGYAEVMRDIPGENTAENVQIIIDEAGRLNCLVEDVLDLSRMEADVEELACLPVNLTHAIQNMVQRCSRMVEKEGYTVSFAADREVWVLGDELRLSQVIYNLIGNALTHCGSDRAVWVELHCDDQWAHVSVNDRGEGIPPEKLKDIWQRYYRVDKVHKRSRVGTGLGLSIVKEIVEKHGGSCSVESIPGSGSSFGFSLPLAPAAEA